MFPHPFDPIASRAIVNFADIVSERALVCARSQAAVHERIAIGSCKEWQFIVSLRSNQTFVFDLG